MKLRDGRVEATDPATTIILRQIFAVSENIRLQTPKKYALEQWFFRRGPKATSVLEFGTYHGTGTTRLVLDALPKMKNAIPYKIPFYTCEANHNNYKIAKENLKKMARWVVVRHGTSLYAEEMVSFIETDELLKHHEDYPDIYFDAHDPVTFYKEEVQGQLSIFGKGTKGREGLLYKLAPLVSKNGLIPLFVLDSAGGIGFLEYQRVVDIMGDKVFYLWVHDTNHLKHFRSLGHMKHSDNVKLIWEADDWALGLFNWSK